MPNRSHTQARRNFLKGTIYASALTLTGVAGFSGITMANDKSAVHQNTDVTEVVDLINHTASPVRLSGQVPVVIAPGEQHSLVVAKANSESNNSANNKRLFVTDVLVNDQLAIRSDYSEFNGIFPATEFGPHTT